jgi:hypothetical protein
MIKKTYLYIALCMGASAYADSQTSPSWDFEKSQIGALPSAFVSDAMGTWEVLQEPKAPSGKQIVKLHKMHRGGAFNTLFNKDVAFKDGEISVSFRADSGEIDQGGGLMWRVQDKDNYYVARFNPLEDNFRFYIVKDANRRELASVDVKLSKGWHTMKIIQKGNHFQGFLDGKVLLEKEDAQLKKAGGIGLWTKADAATSFDDLHVEMQ